MAELIDETAVTPINPAAQPVPADAAPAPESDLPDEVLQIPSIQAILAGAPPAVSFSIEAASKTPEAKLIGKNKQGLQENGVGFYRSLAGDVGVLFNSLKIAGDEIIAADKAGKLLEVAPDAAKVSQDIMASGANHPALNTGASPGGPAGATANVPPQSVSNPMPMQAGPSAGQGRQRLAAMLKNLGPQAATSGANAGQGNLLRSILKPVL